MNVQVQDLIKKAKNFVGEGKYEEALEYIENALSVEKNNPQIWNLKGIALRSMGRYDEAIECFNRSLEIEPKDLNAS